MKKYELVLVMDPATSDADRKSLLGDIQKSIIEGKVENTDDIGMMNLKYDLWQVTWKNRAYFISLLLELWEEAVNELRKFLLYNKSIFRYQLFVLWKNDEFVSFGDVHKELESIIDGRKDTKFGQKVTFYSHKDNQKYITWKALPMLAKYLTRFGDIKPRKYTDNNISTQKKVREAIIRSRELGLLDYIRS